MCPEPTEVSKKCENGSTSSVLMLNAAVPTSPVRTLERGSRVRAGGMAIAMTNDATGARGGDAGRVGVRSMAMGAATRPRDLIARATLGCSGHKTDIQTPQLGDVRVCVQWCSFFPFFFSPSGAVVQWVQSLVCPRQGYQRLLRSCVTMLDIAVAAVPGPGRHTGW